MEPPRAPAPPPPWAVPEARAKVNGTSVVALIASASGYLCFVGVGGVLGVVLGLIARGEVARSEGRESGQGLALTAIVLGGLNVALTVIGLAVGITYLARPTPIAARRASPAATAPSFAPAPSPPAPVPAPPASAERAPRARSSQEAGNRETTLGAITVADVTRDFDAELARQRKAASTARETLVLWVVVPSCKPCDGVAAALTNTVTQQALGKVRFVRVDRDELQPELERLGVPTEKIPGFALLDAHNHPRDFIHGGEWDADVARNIAPVLGAFVHGRYPKRRHPWRAPASDEGAPL